MLALVAIVIIFGPLLLIAHLYSRVGALGRRIEEIEKELDAAVAPSVTAERSPDSPRVETPVKTPARRAEVVDDLVAPETVPSVSAPELDSSVDERDETRVPEEVATGAPAEQAAPRGGALPRRAPARAAEKSRTSGEWEQLVGGRLLNRIGALALIIGVGFFLKYAFDRQWITETMRVLLGGGLGVVLLGLGERSHRKGYDVFGQGLVGAGIAILYLSIYASFNFYHLVPQIAAFALMSAVTATAIAMALRRDSIAIALLGWAGGFLTPIMLSTGSANEVGLFTYLLLLDIGLIAAVWKRPTWSAIEIMTGIATWVIYGAWFAEYFTAAKLENALLFAGLFWALFHALDLARILRRPEDVEPGHLVMSAVNGAAAYLAVLAALDGAESRWVTRVPHDVGLMIGSLAIGALYLASVLFLEIRAVDRAARERYYITAFVAVTAGLFIGFEGFAGVIAWTIAASATMVFAWRRGLGSLYGVSIVLLVFTMLHLIGVDEAFGSDGIASYHGIVSLRSATMLLLAAAFALAAWIRRERNDLLVNVLDVVWCALLFGIVTVETRDWTRYTLPRTGFAAWLRFPRFDAMMIAFGWCALGMAITAARRVIGRAVPVIVAQSIIAFGAIWLAVVGFEVYAPATSVALLFNIRALGLMLAVAVLLVDERILRRLSIDARWLGPLRSSIGIAVILVVLELLSVEVRDHFQRQIVTSGSRPGLAAASGIVNRQQLSLSGVWLVYSLALIVVGIWRRNRTTRVVAFGLFAITILKIFLYDLSFLDTLYRIFSFMGLGVILLAVSWLFQRYRDVIIGSDAKPEEPSATDEPIEA
jgi:uncharacterized membrane protein